MQNKNKLNYLRILLADLILVFWISTVAFAATVYDINGDGKEGLAETIHSLQVTAGHDPETVLYSLTNSFGMTFNLIPAGTFTMGSPTGEPGRDDVDVVETQHQVNLTKSFYMQVTEVTNRHWDAVITDKGRGVNPSSSHTEDRFPVETVNWYEAASFANWLSFDEGLIPCYNGQSTCTGQLGNDFTCTSVIIVIDCTGYRLPTEAQWEYAARATATTAYANTVYFDSNNTETIGGFNTNLHAMGWYIYNLWMTGNGGIDAYQFGSKPVAAKQANRWGLYDMHGNIREWCWDLWDGTAYLSNSVTDPTGDGTGSEHVVRGGAWGDPARKARSAFRNRTFPSDRWDMTGFRLVLPLSQ